MNLPALTATLFPLLRVEADVRYCDRKFDLVNRSDESFERCRWLETMTTSGLSPCEGGVECEGECVPFSEWCTPHTGSLVGWRCGGLVYSPRGCGNETFWRGRLCSDSGQRCSGWWPGQCRQPGSVCRDRSDQETADMDQFCILGGHTLVNISQLPSNMMVCQGQHNTHNVCAVPCDRKLDGCLGDEDEADCQAKSHHLTMVLVLVPCLLLTLLLIESVVRAGVYGKVNQRLLLSHRGRLVAEMNDDEDVLLHLSEFSKIIFNLNNWDLGCRDDSDILHPSYSEGGFEVEKCGKLKQLYKSIRNSNMRDSLQYITYTIQNDQRFAEDPAVSDALKHYSHCLIYHILEKDYLQSRGFTHPTDLDVSIKKELTTRQASLFYGHVFPYFDPLGSLVRYAGNNWKGLFKVIRSIQVFITKTQLRRNLKYALLVTLSVVGWYMDFIKDILIATDLSFLYKSFWDFKSQIVLILWVTVFLSQTITGIYILVIFWTKPSQIFGIGVNGFSPRQKILARVVFCLLAPVSPAVLIYVNKSRERKLRQNEKDLMLMDELNISERISLFKVRQQLLKDKDQLEKLLRMAYKIDNVLENTPQLLIQLLIVLMSISLIQLPGVTGSQAVFDDHVEGNFLSATFFYFSIGWSLQSICFGHITTHIMRKKYVPDLGKLLTFLLFFVACTARIIAIVFFFSPALGIFNVMLPYSIDRTTTYSHDVTQIIGEEKLQEMADISWYYLGSGKAKNVILTFSFFPFIHLILMLILRGKNKHTMANPIYRSHSSVYEIRSEFLP